VGCINSAPDAKSRDLQREEAGLRAATAAPRAFGARPRAAARPVRRLGDAAGCPAVAGLGRRAIAGRRGGRWRVRTRSSAVRFGWRRAGNVPSSQSGLRPDGDRPYGRLGRTASATIRSVGHDSGAMPEITIAVATSPSRGLSLDEEIRLVKPALIYADAVTLISPVASLLQAAVDVGASEDLTMALVRQLGPTLDPQAAEAFAHYDELTRKRRPTREEKRQIAQFRDLLAQGSEELFAKSREILAEAGANELLPAIQAGLVQVDPVIRGTDDAVAEVASAVAMAAGVEAANDSLIAESFMARVRDLLADPFAYPLFDEMVGEIVRSHVAEGLFEVGTVTTRRGKQVTAASRLLETLPAFPAASIEEILDIRQELLGPLTNFRAAVAEMERLIQSAAYDADFPAEVEDLYLEKVAPALQEIAELVRDNSYLRQLMRAGVGDAKSILTGVLTMGVAGLAGVSHLAAAALAAGVPTAAAALRSALATKTAQREIEGHHLFFLYRTEELLLSE
jgi:hypothetical protein